MIGKNPKGVYIIAMNKKDRILTIQDYSCLGRCSLTVALPTISALGVECVGLPTAVLSNHTAFPSWTYLDLTDEMLPITDKWMEFDHSYSMIYTGYLSNEQVPTVLKIIEKLKEDRTLIFVDPAMADRGKLYAGFDQKHVEQMKELIKVADIIKPNLTEACFLTDTPFPGSELSIPKEFYLEVFEKLAKMGPKKIIISGQQPKVGEVADYVYEVGKGLQEYVTPTHPGLYHGTGDLFASAFAALLVKGHSFFEAVKIAHDYVHEAIGYNVKDQIDGLRYGPEFEKAIPFLLKEAGSK